VWLWNENRRYKNMNIVFSSNSGYVKYLYVALMSLFETNEKNELCVYVLGSDITQEECEILKRLAEQYNQKLDVIYVENTFFENALTNERISKESYYRLLIPWILKAEDKALYLDVDMIVNKDLTELYDIDISEYALAACHAWDIEELLKNGRKGFKNLPNDYSYFVTAPLLMNLEWFRNNLNIDDYNEAILELGENFIYHDQDILNYLLYGKVLFIDDIYSIAASYVGGFPILKRKYKKIYSYRYIEENAYLIHYLGYNLWRVGCMTKIYEKWWDYARKSLYFNEIIVKLCEYTGHQFKEEEYEKALQNIYSPYLSRRNADKYFKDNDMHKISLYTAGTMSELLMSEIKNCTDITVEYIFDSNCKRCVDSMNGITIKPLSEIEKTDETDVIVITAWYYHKTIYENIKNKIKVPIVSLLDILAY
jgi:lipopolysaccharide biosynthesis glycosyltransferase